MNINLRLAGALVAYSLSAWLAQAATISINESRTLKALAVELQERYGYLVSYEEAPYDSKSMLSDTRPRPSGLPYLLPAYTATVFHLPDPAPADQPAPPFPTPGGTNTMVPSALLAMIDEHAKAGNPGNFTALFEGGYAHIVPKSQIINGESVDFQPVLGTLVSVEYRGISCKEALDDLLGKVSSQRSVSVVQASVPVGPLLKHECDMSVSNLPARAIVSQILHVIGSSGVRSFPDARYSWMLLYDVNTNRYFFSTLLIPDLMAQAAAKVRPAKTPAGIAPPTNLATPNKPRTAAATADK